MNPYRSGRAWLPAAVLSALFAVTLIVLQLIYHFGYDDRRAAVGTDQSSLEWLFVDNLGFWGPGAFDRDRTQIVIANLSAGVAVILIAFVLTWFALRGTAPGSSVWPAFFSAWLATILAASVGQAVGVLVRSVDQEGYPLGPAIGTATHAATYGLKWGWIAALVATAIWMSVRPKPGVPGLGAPPTTPPTTPPTAPPTSPPTTPPTTGTYPQSPS